MWGRKAPHELPLQHNLPPARHNGSPWPSCSRPSVKAVWQRQKAGHVIDVSSGHKVTPVVISPGAVATEWPNDMFEPDSAAGIQKFQ